MKQFNRQKGNQGEKIGRQFLRRNGYKIIAQNFQTRFGEIDLIASKGRKLIFVEVKLKVGQQFGSPEEMIRPTKIRQIQKTALGFLQSHPQLSRQYPNWQIDAICIVLDQNNQIERISHYESIQS